MNSSDFCCTRYTTQLYRGQRRLEDSLWKKFRRQFADTTVAQRVFAPLFKSDIADQQIKDNVFVVVR
jgi:hypothetical protein